MFITMTVDNSVISIWIYIVQLSPGLNLNITDNSKLDTCNASSITRRYSNQIVCEQINVFRLLLFQLTRCSVFGKISKEVKTGFE